LHRVITGGMRKQAPHQGACLARTRVEACTSGLMHTRRRYARDVRQDVSMGRYGGP